jgi:hypothetical protein
MSTTTPPFRPFRGCDHFQEWHERNCETCTKGPDVEQEGPNERCPIENALVLAMVCGGTINDSAIASEPEVLDLARRLEWDGTGVIQPHCPEREPAP